MSHDGVSMSRRLTTHCAPAAPTAVLRIAPAKPPTTILRGCFSPRRPWAIHQAANRGWRRPCPGYSPNQSTLIGRICLSHAAQPVVEIPRPHLTRILPTFHTTRRKAASFQLSAIQPCLLCLGARRPIRGTPRNPCPSVSNGLHPTPALGQHSTLSTQSPHLSPAAAPRRYRRPARCRLRGWSCGWGSASSDGSCARSPSGPGRMHAPTRGTGRTPAP